MMLEMDAITKTEAAVSTGRDTRRAQPVENPVEPGPQPSEEQRRDYHRDADSDRLVQRLENQLAREAGAEQRREHAEREAIELDIVLDRRDGKRPEQQQSEDDDGGCVIHEWAREQLSRIARPFPSSSGKESGGSDCSDPPLGRIAARLSFISPRRLEGVDNVGGQRIVAMPQMLPV